MPAPYSLRWGIISTGGICTRFVKDILTTPESRDISDVSHTITAVGSRSIASAQKFIDEVISVQPTYAGSQTEKSIRPFATYQEVYDSKDVDIVYIGTPHTFHYENTKDALNAGKHVLCEKPFTFDKAELQELVDLARSKKLFLMEAVWTRFHPIAYELQDVVFSGKYGKIQRMFADLSNDIGLNKLPLTSRMLDPTLGGGALLDLGPYPTVWTMLLLQQHPLNTSKSGPSNVSGTMQLNSTTGVDNSSSWIVTWSDEKTGFGGQSVCTGSMTTVGSRQFSVLINLEKADIQVDYPAYKPQAFTIYPKDLSSDFTTYFGPTGQPDAIRVEKPVKGNHGMAMQADECARCIGEGKTESERMPLYESLIVMDIFDQVREQGKYVVKQGKAGKV